MVAGREAAYAKALGRQQSWLKHSTGTGTQGRMRLERLEGADTRQPHQLTVTILCTWNSGKCFATLTHLILMNVFAIIDFILLIWKLRQREVKQLAQGQW